MAHEYTIRAFNEEFGQLTIECGSQIFAFDIPIVDGNYITGDELDARIQEVCPVWHDERIATVAAGIGNTDAIKALVVPFPVVEPTEEELIIQEAVQTSSSLRVFIEQIVDEKLAAKGL